MTHQSDPRWKLLSRGEGTYVPRNSDTSPTLSHRPSLSSASSYTTGTSAGFTDISSAAGDPSSPSQRHSDFTVTVKQLVLTTWPLMKTKHTYFLIVKWDRGKQGTGKLPQTLLPHHLHNATTPFRINVNKSFSFSTILKRKDSTGEPIAKMLGLKFTFEERKANGEVNRKFVVGEPTINLWEGVDGPAPKTLNVSLTFSGGSVVLTFTENRTATLPPAMLQNMECVPPNANNNPPVVVPVIALPQSADAGAADSPLTATYQSLDDLTATSVFDSDTPVLMPFGSSVGTCEVVDKCVGELCSLANTKSGWSGWEFSPAQEFLSNDTSRSVVVVGKFTPMQCFHFLFGDSSHFLEACHNQRRDTGFETVPWFAVTQWGAFRTAICDIRIGQDHFPCRQRHLAFNVSPRRVVAFTSAMAETVTMGKSVRLEMMFDIVQEEASGTVIVTLRAHTHYQSGMVKTMVGSKLAKQVNKNLDIMERNVQGIFVPLQQKQQLRASRRRTQQGPKTRGTRSQRVSPRTNASTGNANNDNASTTKGSFRGSGTSASGSSGGNTNLTPWYYLDVHLLDEARVLTLLRQIDDEQKRASNFHVHQLSASQINTMLRLVHCYHKSHTLMDVLLNYLEIAFIGLENRKRIVSTPQFVPTITTLLSRYASDPSITRRELLATMVSLHKSQWVPSSLKELGEPVLRRHVCQVQPNGGGGTFGSLTGWVQATASLTSHWLVVEGAEQGLLFAVHYSDIEDAMPCSVWKVYSCVRVLWRTTTKSNSNNQCCGEGVDTEGCGGVTSRELCFVTSGCRNAMLSDLSKLRNDSAF